VKQAPFIHLSVSYRQDIHQSIKNTSKSARFFKPSPMELCFAQMRLVELPYNISKDELLAVFLWLSMQVQSSALDLNFGNLNLARSQQDFTSPVMSVDEAPQSCLKQHN
jgi:hypothetical protein